MKAKFLLGVAMVAALGLSSCDDASRLAGKIAGTWQGEAISMDKNGKADTHKDKKNHHDGDRKNHHEGQDQPVPVEMTCTPTLTFTRNASTNGGDLSITADYTVSQGVVTTEAMDSPVKATVSGTATAAGTWTAKDDDEIIVTLNPAMTSVTVNPSTLELNYAVLTDSPASQLDSIKSSVAANVDVQVKSIVEQRISKLRKFDDIKFIDDNTMKLEIGHRKVTFIKK